MTNDLWSTRDLPVLHAIARLEAESDTNFGLHEIANVTGFDLDVIRRSLLALEHEYIAFKSLSGDGVAVLSARNVRLLGAGRRAVGQWPDSKDFPASDQAGRVRAWVELLRDPPRLVVANSSTGAIRLVCPTVYLQAQPGPKALVGGPLPAVAELAPGYSFVWELLHFRSWSNDPSVKSSLHVHFDDEQGQRWELGHAQVVPIESIDASHLQFVQPSQVPTDALDTTAPASSMVGAVGERVAFVAYVHEDAGFVDRLQADLEDAGITVWRDRDQLIPGDDLRVLIREAIEHRAFAFVPCFSDRYEARDRSYMNEELSIALEEMRRRSQTNWFVPVRFSDCPMPDLDLGLGRRLKDIVWANLFDDWDGEIKRLVRAIRRRV